MSDLPKPKKGHMKTLRWTVSEKQSDEELMEALAEPAKLLAAGEVIGFPTGEQR